MYQVLSPDRIPISMDGIYPSIEVAEEKLTEWIKRYDFQEYYSSVDYGRIPLNQVKNYCSILKIN